MSRRTWLVSVSILGHVGLGVGLWASGMWKLERLESDRRLANIGVMTPSFAAGGAPDLPEVKFKKKEQAKVEKKIAKNVQWDKRVARDDKPKSVETPGGGGDGPEGPGNTIGPPGDPADPLCTVPPCDPPQQPEVKKLPDPPKPPIIAPTALKALRLDGDTQIHPSRNTKNQILADGLTQVSAAVKLCIDTAGSVSSVTVIASTKYPEYDQLLLDGARRWRYRPYTVNGVPTAACSAVNFVYAIK